MHPPTLAELEKWLVILMAAEDWAAVDHWGRQLDTLERQTRPGTTPTLAGSALWYAEQGLPVFPLQPGLKVPHAGTHGVLEASTDPDHIRAWWARWPNSNIGVATGHIVDVVDIDGLAGVQTWANLLGQDPEPFGKIVGTVNTPRAGGTHLYRPAVPGKRNHAVRLPGIDYRGMGGYVVAPPSTHAGRRYSWRHPLNVEMINRGPVR